MQGLKRHDSRPVSPAPAPNAAVAISPWSHMCKTVRSYALAPQPGGVDCRSVSQPLMQRGVLRKEGKVYFVLLGLHGVVYAATTRHWRGKPLLGQLYSTFLFDSYRRPFQYAGDPKSTAHDWRHLCDAFTQAEVKALCSQQEQLIAEVDAQRRMLQTGPQRPCTASELSQCDALQAELRGNIRRFVAESQHALLHCRDNLDEAAQCLSHALTRLRGRTYSTVDLFFGDLVHLLLQDFQRLNFSVDPHSTWVQTALRMAQQAFAPIVRNNGLSNKVGREIWPIGALDSWRTNLDHMVALTADNLALTGNPSAFSCHDVLPKLLRNPSGADKRKPKHSGLLRCAAQPLSHEALREAYHDCMLAKWYFDVRLQRNAGVEAEEILSRPPPSPALRQAAYEAIRARGLAQLQTSWPVHATPAIQSLWETRRRALLTQTAFPFFANVPWRVSEQDAAQVRRHFCLFQSVPHHRGAQAGNCNSIAFALLDAAAEKEQAMNHLPEKPRIDGQAWHRTVGAKHRLRLPRPRVVS